MNPAVRGVICLHEALLKACFHKGRNGNKYNPSGFIKALQDTPQGITDD
jgi:hypothetical protein